MRLSGLSACTLLVKLCAYCCTYRHTIDTHSASSCSHLHVIRALYRGLIVLIHGADDDGFRCLRVVDSLVDYDVLTQAITVRALAA